jgi:hypothetical protein
VGLVIILALVGTAEAYLRSTGAIEAAVRAVNERSGADVYEAIPILSLSQIEGLDGRTYARVRLFDRREKGFPSTTYVRVMRIPDAFWVPEGHPLYIPRHVH